MLTVYSIGLIHLSLLSWSKVRLN